MKIRTAAETDSLALGKIYSESWKVGYKGIIPQSYLDALTAENRAPKKVHNYIVAEADGKIVGLINVGLARDFSVSREIGELRAIYVLPRFWGSGAAAKLFAAGAERLKNEGYAGFYLWVLEENHRARKFYEKMGCRLGAETKTADIGGKDLTEVKYLYTFQKEAD